VEEYPSIIFDSPSGTEALQFNQKEWGKAWTDAHMAHISSGEEADGSAKKTPNMPQKSSGIKHIRLTQISATGGPVGDGDAEGMIGDGGLSQLYDLTNWNDVVKVSKDREMGRGKRMWFGWDGCM
jgi:hypothetical protein